MLKSIRKAAAAGGCPMCAPPGADQNLPLSFGSSTLWTPQDPTWSRTFFSSEFLRCSSLNITRRRRCWSSQRTSGCCLPWVKNLWKKNLFGPKGEVLKGWILLKALSLAVAAGDSSVEAAAAHTKSLLDCYPPDPLSRSNWLQR